METKAPAAQPRDRELSLGLRSVVRAQRKPKVTARCNQLLTTPMPGSRPRPAKSTPGRGSPASVHFKGLQVMLLMPTGSKVGEALEAWEEEARPGFQSRHSLFLAGSTAQT